ncbi:hypothetical protein CONPUDRAFT_151729 [Coniophora puteana RWD-64-598 SS2]|uniref:Uncharacterized protein n=1 Tax=Coniophora puteana (strain RWD-64-598) TaxID=741705 RepID=A0A5M3MUJ1_CONPW|nr:uncharacterized protein CONPUDRAFT_151729 [Coniophora puteana RWD-64-598 SS2]EIW82667.1 hypothetical protein CONPUDRAFT_151729 [Coniophora puteana RWD-64-598 SS2]
MSQPPMNTQSNDTTRYSHLPPAIRQWIHNIGRTPSAATIRRECYRRRVGIGSQPCHLNSNNLHSDFCSNVNDRRAVWSDFVLDMDDLVASVSRATDTIFIGFAVRPDWDLSTQLDAQRIDVKTFTSYHHNSNANLQRVVAQLRDTIRQEVAYEHIRTFGQRLHTVTPGTGYVVIDGRPQIPDVVTAVPAHPLSSTSHTQPLPITARSTSAPIASSSSQPAPSSSRPTLAVSPPSASRTKPSATQPPSSSAPARPAATPSTQRQVNPPGPPPELSLQSAVKTSAKPAASRSTHAPRPTSPVTTLPSSMKSHSKRSSIPPAAQPPAPSTPAPSTPATSRTVTSTTLSSVSTMVSSEGGRSPRRVVSVKERCEFVKERDWETGYYSYDEDDIITISDGTASLPPNSPSPLPVKIPLPLTSSSKSKGKRKAESSTGGEASLAPMSKVDDLLAVSRVARFASELGLDDTAKARLRSALAFKDALWTPLFMEAGLNHKEAKDLYYKITGESY